jgi:hypothetical protein
MVNHMTRYSRPLWTLILAMVRAVVDYYHGVRCAWAFFRVYLG